LFVFSILFWSTYSYIRQSLAIVTLYIGTSEEKLHVFTLVYSILKEYYVILVMS